MLTDKFIRTLAEDKTWLRYTRILAKAEANTKGNDILSEVERLHSSRTSRTLMTKYAITPQDVIQASLIDISNRSRLVELNNELGKHMRLLEVALKAIEGHLKANYTEEIAVYAGKTATDKKTFVQAVLANGADCLNKMEKIREMSIAVIEDIDKTGWSLSNLVKLLEMATYKENIVKLTSI